MGESKLGGKSSPTEMLAEWEGDAIPAPGVLFEADYSGAEGDVVGLASWIGLKVFSGVIGNSGYDAAKKRILGVLTTWQRRFGQAKIDEVKQQLLKQMERRRRNHKITDEELRQRIEALFLQG